MNRSNLQWKAYALLLIVMLFLIRGINTWHLLASHLALRLVQYEIFESGIARPFIYSKAEIFGTIPQCEKAISLLENQPVELDASVVRLSQYISSICEPNTQFIERNLTSNIEVEALSDLSVLYLAHALLKENNATEALDLLRTRPQLSYWYATRGVVESEVYDDDISAELSFELSTAIDGRLHAKKANMYRIQCLWAIESNENTLWNDSCLIFDKVLPTSLSKLLLGRQYYNEADYQQAISILGAAVQRDPTFHNAYYWLGLSYAGLGDSRNALDSHSRGIDGNPSFPWNYYEAARLLMNQGCYSHAKEYLGKMLLLEDQMANFEATRLLDRIADQPDTNCHD